MKPILVQSKDTARSKLEIDLGEYQYFYNPWHYHEELELTLVLKSYGQRQVGDSIENFNPGDLVLVGSNLPHVWKNDFSFFADEQQKNAQAVVVKFLPDFVGNEFLELPEMVNLKDLIQEKASFGIKLEGNLRDEVELEMKTLGTFPKDELIVKVIQILLKISKSKEFRLLASSVYKKENANSNHRINKVLDYIMENYHKNLTLDEMASVLHLNKNAFCRFFKQGTGDSLFTVINRIRIAKACQQLVETDKSVLAISLDVGFTNVSNFNRIFKKTTEMTPLSFRKKQLD